MPQTAVHTTPRHQLADEKLKSLNQQDGKLAVYISPERISWSILDTVHHKVLSAFDFSLDKKDRDNIVNATIQLAEEYKLSEKNFSAVKIAFDLGSSLLVPKELFNEGALPDYLGYATPQPDQPVKDFIAAIPAYNIYGIHGSILEPLRGVFDRMETIHASTAFIQNILKENKNRTDSRLFAHFSGSHLHLAALEAGKFAFYNSYAVKTKEDFVYFLLAVIEELNFHPEQISVSLSGDITPDSDNYQAARKFLRQLTFAERPKALKYSSRLDTIPKHLFALLYSIHLCE